MNDETKLFSKELKEIRNLVLELYFKKNKEYEIFNEQLNEIIFKNDFKKFKNINITKQEEVALIIYPDQFKTNKKDLKNNNNKNKLKILKKEIFNYFNEFDTIHLLPFHEYSSDDGFSIIDFYKIKKSFGNWRDIQNISKNKTIIKDLVLNHASSKSKYFKDFCLRKNDFFIKIKKKDIKKFSKVFRPRDKNLFHDCKDYSFYNSFNNKKEKNFLENYSVLTTFSKDQVDFNYHNYLVLLEIIKIMIHYIIKIKDKNLIIRLDATPYLWKKEYTSCINLKETHKIIQILKFIIKIINKKINGNIRLLTENNFNEKINKSYLNEKESDLIYNFDLPIFLVYSYFKKDGTLLINKLKKFYNFEDDNFNIINFSSSHDGIGINPIKKEISSNELNKLNKFILNQKGFISKGKNKEPYEYNIVYNRAFSNKSAYFSSQAIILSLRGISTFYINDILDVSKNLNLNELNTKNYRQINRKKITIKELIKQTKKEHFITLKKLILIKKSEKAFKVNSKQEIFNINDCLVIYREYKKEKIICIYNFENNQKIIDKIFFKKLFKYIRIKNSKFKFYNLLDKKFTSDKIIIKSQNFLWLKIKSSN